MGLNDIVQIIVRTVLPTETVADTPPPTSSEQNSEEHMETVSVCLLSFLHVSKVLVLQDSGVGGSVSEEEYLGEGLYKVSVKVIV